MEQQPNETLSVEERAMLKEIGSGVRTIVQKLHKEIIRGDYGAVVGEDVSGRLPALMLGDVIKTLSNAHGQDAPLIRFMAGGTGLTTKEMDAKLSLAETQMRVIKNDMEKRFGIAKKVLISTEAIDTGQSMGILAVAARNAGLATDVATIGFPLALVPLVKTFLKAQWRASVIHASLQIPAVSKISNEMAGVEKNPTDLFSTRRKKISGETSHAESQNKIDTAVVRAARAEARKISNHIAQSFLQQSP